MNYQYDIANVSSNTQLKPLFNQINNSQKISVNKDIKNSICLHLPPCSNQLDTNSSSNHTKRNIVRMRFSPQEDEELVKLVSIYGDQDWNKISAELTKQSPINVKRSARQCKDRYINYLSPEISNSEWTTEEDQVLIFNFLQSPSHWKSMTNLLNGRSEVAIKNRFKYLYKEGLNLLKPIIKNNIPNNDHNQQNTNTRKSDFKSNNNNNNNIHILPDPNHFLKQINVNLGTVTSNQINSLVTQLFNTSNKPLNANGNNCKDNTSSIFSEFDENVPAFQIESETESFDTLNLFDMF